MEARLHPQPDLTAFLPGSRASSADIPASRPCHIRSAAKKIEAGGLPLGGYSRALFAVTDQLWLSEGGGDQSGAMSSNEV